MHFHSVFVKGVLFEYMFFKGVFFNPFTLRVPLESIVCYFHTFENNLEINQKFSK